MTEQITGAARVAPTGTLDAPAKTPVVVTVTDVQGKTTTTASLKTGEGLPFPDGTTVVYTERKPEPLEEIKAAGKTYADALLEETEAQRAYDEAFADFAKQHAALFIRKDEARRAVKDADARVRNLADSYCQEHGVAPVEWVGMQMRTQVSFENEQTLFDAVLKYMPFLLTLDMGRLEKFVINNVVESVDKGTGEKTRALPSHFRLPVTVSLKPTVTISTGKLSKLMEEKPE